MQLVYYYRTSTKIVDQPLFFSNPLLVDVLAKRALADCKLDVKRDVKG